MHLIKHDPDFQIDSASIEDCLTYMRKYGSPAVRHSKGNGWWSSIEMDLPFPDGEFKIGHDGYTDTPISSLQMVIDNIHKALEAYK